MKVTTLISKLGGVPAVAKELESRTGKKVSTGTVYRWRDRETISYRWRPVMAQIAAAKGLKVPAELAMFMPSEPVGTHQQAAQ